MSIWHTNQLWGRRGRGGRGRRKGVGLLVVKDKGGGPLIAKGGPLVAEGYHMQHTFIKWLEVDTDSHCTSIFGDNHHSSTPRGGLMYW